MEPALCDRPFSPVRLALIGIWVTAAAFVAGARLGKAGEPGARAPIDFRRQILPLLSDHCFACHGPDAKARKAGLRLDQREGALRTEDPVIVPGQGRQSELIERLRSEDPEEHMPPPGKGRALSAGQIDLIERWIDEGAGWKGHWAFEPLRPGAVPEDRLAGWARSPIDRFVLARLQALGFSPSPEAAPETLLRRVTLDLTGLPPTPEEIDVFLTDGSPAAYEAAVERLLNSPRFGERMASRWLDAARYADTNGYQSDGERIMWRYRDWVINAYNHNLPFDQFTVEQLAGDLLPQPTLDQLIATGFNRNHRGNAEGGIIPEEYAVEYVVDRVETTATVWLGLTIGCARCHDHKFDPITQREFYQLYAFFNNVPERGKAIKFGNSPPLIVSPTPMQQERLQSLDTQVAAAGARLAALEPQIAGAQAGWEQTVASSTPAEPDWSPTEGLLVQFTHDGGLRTASGEATPRAAVAPRSGSTGDPAPILDAGDLGDFGFLDKFTCAAWVKIGPGGGGIVVSRMVEGARSEGYSLAIDEGRIQVNLVKRWLDDALRVETTRPLSPGTWHHVAFSYDGTRVAQGVRVLVDGEVQELRVLLDDLNQSFQTHAPLRIGGGATAETALRGELDDVRVYRGALSDAVIALLAETESLAAIAGQRPAARTPRQRAKLRAAYLERGAPGTVKDAVRQLQQLSRERDRFVEQLPTTMIMRETDPPRPAHVLIRGAYDKPGERVDRGVPACLPAWPAGAPPNRLGLARWLVDPANPLPPRVAVNRFWQVFFGTGFVKTTEDFGVQGEQPSHPELLDWLAAEFVASGWDVKHLLRLFVTSATYRQASEATSEQLRRDPENRLLARGPRYRLPAEMIRDQALAASGLLVERLGGPSVRPYQPAGLWKELTGGEDYHEDRGPSLYRRSLYTFWKRTVAPPSMVTFDAAGRETCTVREVRTNTPLQALNLLNDVTFVEAARVLAERVLHEGPPGDEAGRIDRLMRRVVGRAPSPQERPILAASLRSQRASFAADPAAARQLISVGAAPRDPALDPCELAAYTALASVVLNLDETINKE